MALVAIVALDIATFNTLWEPPSFLSNGMSLLIVWALLPMANVLAFGLVLLLTRPGPIGRRPFLVRFEVCGSVVFLLVLAVCSMASYELSGGIFERIKSLGVAQGGSSWRWP